MAFEGEEGGLFFTPQPRSEEFTVCKSRRDSSGTVAVPVIAEYVYGVTVA